MIRNYSFSADSVKELVGKIQNFSGFRPTLGIIFSSVALGIPDLETGLSSIGLPLFGCSTSGEILSEGSEDPVFEESAVCCLLDIDPSLFSVRLFKKGDESDSDLGKRIGDWGKGIFADPAFIIAIAGLKNDGEAIIQGIESVIPEGQRIYGGIAGDDFRFSETYAFTSDGYSVNGAAVIIFDRSRVEVEGFTTSGWVGVGTDMVITLSKGNTVYKINNRPPVEIFREYLQVTDEELQHIGVSFPLFVRRKDGSEIARTFLSVDYNDGSMVFAGSIPTGARVRFSSSFGYDIIEKAVRDLKNWHTDHPGADLLILFSCKARHLAAGPMVVEEIRAASDLWNAPLIGFFSYGEIGPTRSGTCDLHNETLSLVRIRLHTD